MSTSTLKHPPLTATARHVVTQQSNLPSHSNRLPNYRCSYRERYHPYGRILPRNGRKIDLMKTIDARCDNGGGSRTSVSLSVVEEEDEDELPAGEWEETVGDTEDSETSSPHNDLQLTAPRPKALVRRRSFSDLVVEIAFAMRRSLQLKHRLKLIRS